MNFYEHSLNPKMHNSTRLDKFLTIIYLAIVFLMAVLIAYLKLRGLFLWNYTSDIFIFDQVMGNTLTGNFGIDFTYGNQFGEHAFFILLLLLPFKLILNNNMVFMLALLGPIFYAFSGILLFFHLKTSIRTIGAFILSLSYLLLFGITYRALFESLYGFHPDILAGFCMLLFTICILEQQKLNRLNKNSKYYLAGFGLFYIIFVSLKQEMALLAMIFFFLTYLFDKRHKRFNLCFLLVSSMIFLLGTAFVSIFQTEFNRGNATLIHNFFVLIQKEKLNIFLKDIVIKYYFYIGLLTIAFLSAFLSNLQFNSYIFAMFLIAILKSTFAFLSNDFSLLTWHNFPCVVLITGAITLQLGIDNRSKINLFRFTTLLIFLLSGIIFVKNDLAFFFNKNMAYESRSEIIGKMSSAIHSIKAEIPEDKIVAVPAMSAVEWVDRMCTFYDRGVNSPPRGIADYVVLPKENNDIPLSLFCLIYCRPNESNKIKNEFSLIKENGYFMVFRRYHISKKNLESRLKFIKYFNMPK